MVVQLIEKIKETLSKNNIQPVLEFNGTININSAPVRYIDCNLSDWSDFHGIKDIHVLVYTINKHALVIIQSNCSYTDCNHIGITIIPKSSVEGLIVGISKSKNNTELITKSLVNFVNKVVPLLIVYDIPINDDKGLVVEKYTIDKITSLIDVVTQMMKDKMDVHQIIDFMCGYRGLIDEKWKNRLNKRISLEDLRKNLDKETLTNIEIEVNGLEKIIKEKLNKERKIKHK